MAGCLYIFFRDNSSHFNINQSLIANNFAALGGGLYVNHEKGIFTLTNTKFINNRTPFLQNFGGAAITVNGLITSIIISKNNFFNYNGGFQGFLLFLND